MKPHEKLVERHRKVQQNNFGSLAKEEMNAQITQKISIAFGDFTNDLEKCEYYPVYHSVTKEFVGWDNRNDSRIRKTTPELFDLFLTQYKEK